MRLWDPTATAALNQAVERLRAAGFVDAAAAEIDRIWRGNVDRADRALGDTDGIISRIASADAHSRLEELCAPGGALAGLGAGAGRDPVGALRIHVGGEVLAIAKVPHGSGIRPRWQRDFTWTDKHNLLGMAKANDGVLPTPHVEALIPPLFDLPAAEAVPGRAGHVLVWGGVGGAQPVTAGWLGIPSAATERWLAVAELWGPTATLDTTVESANGGNPMTFEDVPTPSATVTAKGTARRTGRR